MNKKRNRFADKRFRYRLKREISKAHVLRMENNLLRDEIVELKTSDFNHIFHMDEQRRIVLG